jgi:hypothetical protein
MVDGVGSRGCMILPTLDPVSSVRRRGGMLHNKHGEAIPGTDVTHFFSLSPKVGQRQADCRAISVDEISNGSPGWIRTPEGARWALAAANVVRERGHSRLCCSETLRTSHILLRCGFRLAAEMPNPTSLVRFGDASIPPFCKSSKTPSRSSKTLKLI